MDNQPGILGRLFEKFQFTLGSERRLEWPEETRGRLQFAAGLCLIFIALFFGWRLFWFLTDDAFISFRYASNHIAGWGYTWNPPPFRPVEGYSNFLWVVLLEWVWRIFGIAPPDSANYITLLFSCGTLAVGVLIGMRFSLTGGGSRYRHLLVFMALAGTVSNRTFLAWTSSGLETALFVFLITLWVYVMLYTSDRPRLWVFSSVLAATLLYFTRPDGMLILAATMLAVVLAASFRLIAWRHMVYALPVLSVPVHLAWRKTYYHAWLPNTYYAKYVKAWPEAGIRYALSFIIEYSLFIWILLAAAFVVKGLLETHRGGAERIRVNIPVITVLGAITGVLAYYTLVIGGDHFEYRIYAHLVMLLFLSGAWLADKLFAKGGNVVAVVFLSVALSIPIPWTHWAHTQHLQARNYKSQLKQEVADFFPLFHGYVKLYDDMQDWLISHFICLRHQEHKVFYEYLSGLHVKRETGKEIKWEDRAVYVCVSVGVPGWVYPNMAIIDALGLNDYVAARTPVDTQAETRLMAHERISANNYIKGFRPNFFQKAVGNHMATLLCDESRRLTDEEIIHWEDLWWEWADNPDQDMPAGFEAEYHGLMISIWPFTLPDAAEKVNSSPDGGIYTFDIRKGMYFSGGSELTASDFKYTLEHILLPSTGSPSAPLFMGIKGAREFVQGAVKDVRGIKVLGRYELSIELEEPDKQFGTILSIPEANAMPAE